MIFQIELAYAIGIYGTPTERQWWRWWRMLESECAEATENIFRILFLSLRFCWNYCNYCQLEFTKTIFTIVISYYNEKDQYRSQPCKLLRRNKNGPCALYCTNCIVGDNCSFELVLPLSTVEKLFRSHRDTTKACVQFLCIVHCHTLSNYVTFIYNLAWIILFMSSDDEKCFKKKRIKLTNWIARVTKSNRL